MSPLIDTHQHLMYPKQFGYSWANELPVLHEKQYNVSSYEALVGDQVSASVFMETGVDESDYRDETEFAISLARDPSNNTVGVIAAAFPEHTEEFEQWLEQTVDEPLILGYRRILHVVDNSVSKDSAFRKNVRRIGAHEKTFDMCFLEAQLDLANAFAAACDNTQLVLDHCGVPNIANGDYKFWKSQIAELAKMDHVACKISGLVAYCAPDQDREVTVRPYIEFVVEQFGADRCVWGSDWPVVNMAEGLPEWLNVTKRILGEETIETQSKIFSENARSIYGVAG